MAFQEMTKQKQIFENEAALERGTCWVRELNCAGAP